MRPLNLIRSSPPPSVRSRRRSHLSLAIPGLAIGLLSAVLIIGQKHLNHLDEQIASQIDLERPQENVAVAIAGGEEIDTKSGVLAAIRRARNAIPPAVAMTKISEALPEGVMLSEFEMVTTTAGLQNVSRRRSGVRTDDVSQSHVTSRLSGLAEDEIKVAETVERLNQINVLGEARIVESYPIENAGDYNQAFVIEIKYVHVLTNTLLAIGEGP